MRRKKRKRKRKKKQRNQRAPVPRRNRVSFGTIRRHPNCPACKGTRTREETEQTVAKTIREG
jgi:hypothetical protein